MSLGVTVNLNQKKNKRAIQNLKYNVKSAGISFLILISIPSSLTLSIKVSEYLFLHEIKKYCFLHKTIEKPYLNLHFKFHDFFP